MLEIRLIFFTGLTPPISSIFVTSHAARFVSSRYFALSRTLPFADSSVARVLARTVRRSEHGVAVGGSTQVPMTKPGQRWQNIVTTYGKSI